MLELQVAHQAAEDPRFVLSPVAEGNIDHDGGHVGRWHERCVRKGRHEGAEGVCYPSAAEGYGRDWDAPASCAQAFCTMSPPITNTTTNTSFRKLYYSRNHITVKMSSLSMSVLLGRPQGAVEEEGDGMPAVKRLPNMATHTSSIGRARPGSVPGAPRRLSVMRI